MSLEITDVPLPEGSDEAPARKHPETAGLLDQPWGWRITWGRKIGQRKIQHGTVTEFEHSPHGADRLFRAKVRHLKMQPDTEVDVPGRYFVHDSRTGKYVERVWVPKP